MSIAMDYDNEIDEFDANREKVLLDAAGKYARGVGGSDSEGEDEVMGFENDNDNDNDDYDEEEDDNLEDDDEENDNEDEDDKGWGGRQNYYGGEDVSDDEDAKQMTEEALRQQKKHLQDLAMDDYVDEEMMEGWQKAAEPATETVVEAQAADLHALDDKERMAVLNERYPEFVPLLTELQKLKPQLEEYKASEGRLAQVKAVALSAYLGLIASYFALFTDGLRTGEAFSMKDSAVMEAILTSREVWRQASEIVEGGEKGENLDSEEENEEEVENEEDVEGEEDVEDEEEVDSELEDYSEENDNNSHDDNDSQNNDEFNIDLSKRRTTKARNTGAVSDYTETGPDDVDMEDKQRRRKSLRFYTAKIDKAAKKNSVHSSDYAGDLDLPYQERLFERQQRLIEEARKRGLSKQGADLDDEEPEQRSDNDNDAWDDDGLDDGLDDSGYAQLKEDKERLKVARRQAHEDAVAAAKHGKLAELAENVGEDGKRALNFQILKNKGLTPHRKKENRNSRVKKRKQYEKAQKKLKSVRKVYEGSQGPYEGEKTGIKKNTTRSVKLV